MLAMARAIITNPRLLLVDEMSLGLAPLIVQQMMPVVRSVADAGAAVIIVEQHVHLALDLADRAVVVANGRVAVEGPAAELRGDLSRIRRDTSAERRRRPHRHSRIPGPAALLLR